jgi:hypothetical protein
MGEKYNSIGRFKVDMASPAAPGEEDPYLTPGPGGTGQSAAIEELSMDVNRIADEGALDDVLARAKSEAGKIRDRAAVVEGLRLSGDPRYEQAASVLGNDQFMLIGAQNSIRKRLELAALRLKNPITAAVVEEVDGTLEDFWLDKLTGMLGGAKKRADRVVRMKDKTVVTPRDKTKLREAQERARLRELKKFKRDQAERAGKHKQPHVSKEEEEFLAQNERNRELAYDPATDSFKPGEARAALAAEADGILQPPVTRATDPALDFLDGNGVPWDAKEAVGLDSIGRAVQAGENVLVHGTRAQIEAVQAAFGPASGTLRYVVVNPPGG